MSGRRLFPMSAPDWGHTHLSSDAVVAFVDDELARGPHGRAVEHVADCPECEAEVVAQRQARTALRGAAGPALPQSLLSSLRAIPQDTELPPMPAGLALGEDGQLGMVLRPEPERPAPSADSPAPAVRVHATRRLRLGAGAAVSGLALGALALGGAAALPGDTPQRPADRGVLGGSVLGGSGVVDARLGIDVSGRGSDARTDRAARTPRAFLRHGPRE